MLEVVEDPYALLTFIQEQDVRPEHRQIFYRRFTVLVALRADAAERDRLIAMGLPIFRYRAETARAAIKEIQAEGASSQRVESSVCEADFMAEIVHDLTGPLPIRYCVYAVDTNGQEEIRFAPDIAYRGIRHTPPQTGLINTGTITLPTGTDEYGTLPRLYKQVRRFVASYLYVTDTTSIDMIALYILLSWIYDKFTVVPYLRALGSYGTGKSRLLQVVSALGHRSINAGGATTAAPIFRIMDRFHGMLIVDEADFHGTDIENEVTKVLTTGYMKGFPVLRAERDKDDKAFSVTGYDCYGPKVLSTRKKFYDEALESRCLTIEMQPVLIPEEIPFFLDDEFKDRAIVLRNKLLLWRFRTWRTLTANPRKHMPWLDSRLNQIILPLLACCQGNTTMEAAIMAHAGHYQETMKATRRESFEGRVAYHLLMRRKTAQNPERVPVQDVIDSMASEVSDSPRLKRKTEMQHMLTTLRTDIGCKVEPEGGESFVHTTDRDVKRIAYRFALTDMQPSTKAEGSSTRQPVT
jgi:hypothetical protein